jgi:hypothetical protein
MSSFLWIAALALQLNSTGRKSLEVGQLLGREGARAADCGQRTSAPPQSIRDRTSGEAREARAEREHQAICHGHEGYHGGDPGVFGRGADRMAAAE